MGLAEFAPSRSTKGPRCTAGVLVESLTPDQRAELADMVAKRWTWVNIAATLNNAAAAGEIQLDRPVKAYTLSRHLGEPRGCDCDDTV